jgi:hypothetical protein
MPLLLLRRVAADGHLFLQQRSGLLWGSMYVK